MVHDDAAITRGGTHIKQGLRGLSLRVLRPQYDLAASLQSVIFRVECSSDTQGIHARQLDAAEDMKGEQVLRFRFCPHLIVN